MLCSPTQLGILHQCLFFCILSDVNKEECRFFYKLVLHFEDAFIILATWGFHVLNEQL